MMLVELKKRMLEVAAELDMLLDDDLSDATDDAVAQLCDEFECDDVDFMYARLMSVTRGCAYITVKE